ncbi:MAG: DNA mismatch repair protein MutS [Acidobacteriota bacterium]|nr:DNA mismatch repair protein MutS [Acidobacteriota bacterium]
MDAETNRTEEQHCFAEAAEACYARRLKECVEQLNLALRHDRWLGICKVVLGLVLAGGLVWYAYAGYGIGPLTAGVLVFAVLAVMHERVLQRVKTIRSTIRFYERGLARLENKWAGSGEEGAQYLDPTHPYARDLDLFGKGSLFELLCTCHMEAGKKALANWLLERAEPEEICARQETVRALQGGTAFRERLFTAGAAVKHGVGFDEVLEWAKQKEAPGQEILSAVAAVLAVLLAGSLVWAVWRSEYLPLTIVAIVNLGLSRILRKRVEDNIHAVDEAAEDLSMLVAVMMVLESEDCDAPRFAKLQQELCTDGVSATAAMKKLKRIGEWIESRDNLVVRVTDRFIFYSLHAGTLAVRWRRKFGGRIAIWLEIVAEMEALAALSGYAYEHPENAWPEVAEGSARFEAEEMAHPLLPAATTVPSDLDLGQGVQLLIVSGPNMAGKSTLIRAAGLNAVLAQCGAPVRARRLRMSPLAVGASICVLDSLQGGVSRFYAEIKRLKQIADLAEGTTPVLFLLDELLSGTNSHDRAAGTELIVRSLVERGAIGMVTTHDLALTHIPETMDGKAANGHFEDRLVDGKLVFDFKLQPGVAKSSNALKLMQAIGLTRE